MTHPSISDLLQTQFLRLDVEYGNAHGFFSASKKGIQALTGEQDSESSRYDSQIHHAKISIEDAAISQGCEMIRKTKFKIETETKLYDLVSRFVIFSDDRKARIAGTEIQHNCRNLYNQYATGNVVVPIGENGHLEFFDDDSEGHPAFDNVFYIRDEGVEKNGLKRWIVHHRMIAIVDSAELIVRCCHPKFEGPLSLQKIIPQFIKRKLFRIREELLPNFPFMTVGESTVAANHTFTICTRVRYTNE